MKKIAAILSLALQERDMRIHELVRLSGVSKSSVYRVLGEECVPSWDMALNLIESLGGKVEIVFPGSSSPDGHPDLWPPATAAQAVRSEKAATEA